MFGFMCLPLCLSFECVCVCVIGSGGLRCHSFQSNPGSLSAGEEASRELCALLTTCIFRAGVISTSWWLGVYRAFFSTPWPVIEAKAQVFTNNTVHESALSQWAMTGWQWASMHKSGTVKLKHYCIAYTFASPSFFTCQNILQPTLLIP